tara:strand:+ start:97 stop:513 length:417 start_codon:yes stop_codon:yes gene_type:complete
MDKIDLNSFSDMTGEKKPIFVKASGYYVMHPLLFMHTWNLSSSIGEVVNLVRQHWNQYAHENVLLPDKNGIIKEPKIDSNCFLNRVQSFRKNGAFMKKLPKASVARYNWNEIVSQSKQYADSAAAPRKDSPSKSFFGR